MCVHWFFFSTLFIVWYVHLCSLQEIKTRNTMFTFGRFMWYIHQCPLYDMFIGVHIACMLVYSSLSLVLCQRIHQRRQVHYILTGVRCMTWSSVSIVFYILCIRCILCSLCLLYFMLSVSVIFYAPCVCYILCSLCLLYFMLSVSVVFYARVVRVVFYVPCVCCILCSSISVVFLCSLFLL